jgi:arylsulfatase A-like enzyme
LYRTSFRFTDKQADYKNVQFRQAGKKDYLYIMRTMLIVTSLLLFCCGCHKVQHPDIILIMADDLGYGDLGCYGSHHMDTPNMDRLAALGIRFLDYHSNGAVCSPTRAALMTGRYQQRSGLGGVVTAAGHRHTGLSPDELTIADFLRSRGYHTGMVGKWHLGYDTAFSPLNNGFDYFKGYVSGNIDYHSHIDQAGFFDWWQGKDTLVEEGYVTDLITEASLDFIRTGRKAPFFLYIAHEAPHYPYQGRTDRADRTIGGEFPNQGSRPDRKNAYREMVQAMDEGIGKILAELEISGQLENTFIFFCSDNGANEIGSNGPLKGFKGRLWEGGHRVPAIAVWKGHLEPGLSKETVLSMDLFPTIVSLVNDEEFDIQSFDGISIGPAMLQGASLPERSLFWRFKNQQSVRTGPWKLLIDETDTLLYNLETDPGEKMDVAGEHRTKVDSLGKTLDQWNREMDLYTLRTR